MANQCTSIASTLLFLKLNSFESIQTEQSVFEQYNITEFEEEDIDAFSTVIRRRVAYFLGSNFDSSSQPVTVDDFFEQPQILLLLHSPTELFFSGKIYGALTLTHHYVSEIIIQGISDKVAQFFNTLSMENYSLIAACLSSNDSSERYSFTDYSYFKEYCTQAVELINRLNKTKQDRLKALQNKAALIKLINELPCPITFTESDTNECPVTKIPLTQEQVINIRCDNVWHQISRNALLQLVNNGSQINPINKQPLTVFDVHSHQPWLFLEQE